MKQERINAFVASSRLLAVIVVFVVWLAVILGIIAQIVLYSKYSDMSESFGSTSNTLGAQMKFAIIFAIFQTLALGGAVHAVMGAVLCITSDYLDRHKKSYQVSSSWEPRTGAGIAPPKIRPPRGATPPEDE